MNLISYDFGQALQLIRMDEIRPNSGIYMPGLEHAIYQRYRLAGGAPQQPPQPDGIKGENGVISLDGRQIAIKTLGLYSDGLLVACWNTDDADLVIDDFIIWATEAFKLRERRTIVPRKYSSSVVVQFSASIDKLLSKFDLMSRLYEDAFEANHGTKIETHIQRLALGPVPESGANASQTTLIIERRALTASSEMTYFSAAPLTSSAHLELLTNIEHILIDELRTPSKPT